ncbi:MAG TPA: hypothetical protein VFM63_13445 [Pyrinomonadaceae bacterium]|nr:hypothetical protein [Pyrinomonadaceae bacterium]
MASGSVSMVVCREEVGTKRQQELTQQLRAITGWPDLHFDSEGALRPGDAAPIGGSQTARELLASAQKGRNLIVIEDASGQADVVFGRVVEARWKGAAERPPAFLVQLDFSDFSQVIGDAEALASFNAAWVALHEIHHATNDAPDTTSADETGQCEELINLMRRECKLAIRAEYHFHFFPGQNATEFKTRYVRLAFEHQNPSTNKKSRVWLMWDAAYVGGLPPAPPNPQKLHQR